MIRVCREDLLSALESVTPGLTAKEVYEQSSSFVFKAGRVHTYNTEVACSAPSPLGDIEGAVAATPLLTLLRKTSDDNFQVDQGEGMLNLFGKRKRTRILMDAEADTPADRIEIPEEWLPLREEYGEALRVVQECAGRNPKEFISTCVHIAPKWIEAFDNFQMVRYKIKTGMDKSAVVKRDAIKHVAGMGANEFAAAPGWLHYRNPSGLIISCRRYVEEFVNLTSNLNVEGESVTLPKGMDACLSVAEVFSGQDIENNYVSVRISKGEMRITGEGASGDHSEKRDVAYDGPKLDFMIAPKLLRYITDKHSEATVNGTRLKVRGNRWAYVACLISR